jgi:hypothetical protein
MSASIRGHQARFEVYKEGKRQVFDTITKVTINLDSDFVRSEYVGNAIPEGDQIIRGWSGSIDMEVKDASVDNFIDALITDNLNGIGVQRYFFIVSEFYPNGTNKSYVYSDCQFKMSREQGGMGEKITKRLEFQASVRNSL